MQSGEARLEARNAGRATLWIRIEECEHVGRRIISDQRFTNLGDDNPSRLAVKARAICGEIWIRNGIVYLWLRRCSISPGLINDCAQVPQRGHRSITLFFCVPARSKPLQQLT